MKAVLSQNEQLRTAAGFRNHVSGEVVGLRWPFLLQGLVALGWCASALIWPSLILSLLIRVIGLYTALFGAMGVVCAIRDREQLEYLMLALASLLVGALLFVWPVLMVR